MNLDLEALSSGWAVFALGGVVAFAISVFTGLLFLSFASQNHRKTAWYLSGLTTGLIGGLLVPALVYGLLGRLTDPIEIGVAITLPLGVACLGFAVGAWTQGSFLRSLPVSPVAYAAHAIVKVRGQAQATNGLVYSRTGGIPAIWYSEHTERYTAHQVSEYDSQSKTTRTRTEYRWDHVGSATDGRPFELKDPTGSVWVGLERAEFCIQQDAHFYNGFPHQGLVLSASVGDERTTVHFLPDQTMCTVIGRLSHEQLGYDSYRKCFLIVDGDDSRVYRGRSWRGLGLFILGLLLIGGPAAYFIQDPSLVEGKVQFLAAAACVGIAVGLGIYVIRVSNMLRTLRNEIRRTWSDVDVALRQRADLIPNLVKTCQAIAQHEQSALVKLAEERGQALAAPRSARLAAEDQLGQRIRSVVALAEAMPELKAGAAFLNLQTQLVQAEESIADARESYQQALTDFADACDSFPGKYVASMVARD